MKKSMLGFLSWCCGGGAQTNDDVTTPLADSDSGAGVGYGSGAAASRESEFGGSEAKKTGEGGKVGGAIGSAVTGAPAPIRGYETFPFIGLATISLPRPYKPSSIQPPQGASANVVFVTDKFNSSGAGAVDAVFKGAYGDNYSQCMLNMEMRLLQELSDKTKGVQQDNFFPEIILRGPKYFIMTYYQGKDLFTVIQNKNRIYKSDEYPKRRMMLQLASAISCLHRHDVVHRDLKPENIMLDQFHNIKVVDFGHGLSEMWPSSCTHVGTLGCRSPEQIKGGVDTVEKWKRVDVWALALLFFSIEAETVALPFGVEKITRLEELSIVTAAVLSEGGILGHLRKDDTEHFFRNRGVMLERGFFKNKVIVGIVGSCMSYKAESRLLAGDVVKKMVQGCSNK